MEWSAASQFYKRLTHSCSSVLEKYKVGLFWSKLSKHLISLGPFYGLRSEKDQKRSQSRVFQCSNFYLKEFGLEKYTLIPFNGDIKISPRVYSTYSIKHSGVSKTFQRFRRGVLSGTGLFQTKRIQRGILF